MAAYVALLAILSGIALHRVGLALSARRLRVVEPPPPLLDDWPTVLVQIPIYNERHVARRVIEAVCALRYPRERLTIQVLDDSTDNSASIVLATVDRLAASGQPITVIHRAERTGYKAGALANGLCQSTAELVAIFDADFVPQPDFLERLVPHFSDRSNQAIGMVQACWGHLNRDDNMLTKAQAVLLDGHFLNEHAGRCARGCFFNFNGTAGIWRRRCIDDAGGWLARTITEDLDLSYRAQLRGWRFLFRPDVVVPAELPPSVDAFKVQQHRWAKGSIETARLILPLVWRQPGLSWRRRVEATFHLLGNLAYPLVIGVALLVPGVVLARAEMLGPAAYLLDATLLFGATGSLVFFYVVAIRRAGLGWRGLLHLPAALAVGVGLAINNSIAVVEALAGRRSPFERTPKLGSRPASFASSATRRRRAANQAEVEPSYLKTGVARGWGQTVAELLLGTYLLFACALAMLVWHLGALPFLGLFAWGFLVLGSGSLRYAHARARPRAGGKALTPPPWPKRI